MTYVKRLIPFGIIAMLALSGCAPKTQSILPEHKGIDKPVTQPQLKIEEAVLHQRVATKKAAFASETANLDKLAAEINADVVYIDTVVPAANADILAQYEQRDYVLNTASAVVEAVVPAPLAPVATAGMALLTIGLGAFGVIQRKKTQAAAAAEQLATAGLDMVVKAVAKKGATSVAEEVNMQSKVKPVEGSFVAGRVTATNTDILQV
jgi:hypothetical protein